MKLLMNRKEAHGLSKMVAYLSLTPPTTPTINSTIEKMKGAAIDADANAVYVQLATPTDQVRFAFLGPATATHPLLHYDAPLMLNTNQARAAKFICTAGAKLIVVEARV